MSTIKKTSVTLEEIYTPIEKYLPKVESRIFDILSTSNELSGDVIRYFFETRGKFLRPALVLLAATFGKKDLESVIPVAAAIEIFHSATLIHDDIIDSAYLRRNLPTINTKWNTQLAVLIGDFLHDRAITAVFNTKNERLISAFLNTAGIVCDGEILELKEKNNFNLKEEMYLAIIERKTAKLLATCLEAGAVMAGLTDDQIVALERYGIYFGMAFQIMDDCLDFTAEESDFGKTPGADLQAGVLTLPLIRLVSLLDDERKAKIFSAVKSGLNVSGLETIVGLLKEYGALDYAVSKAGDFTDRASLEISIFPNSPSKKSLELLLDYVLKRNR